MRPSPRQLTTPAVASLAMVREASCAFMGAGEGACAGMKQARSLWAQGGVQRAWVRAGGLDTRRVAVLVLVPQPAPDH